MIKMILYMFVFILLIIQPCMSQDKNVIQYNSGIIYGTLHVFMLTAPEGWVLDNQSGVNQGLHAVFYPKGQTWQDNPIIAYAKGRVKDSTVNSIEDQVNETIKHFKEHGNPNFKGEYIKDINLQHTKIAKIYFYSGDQWGNYEAAAYINENKTIILIILNSRKKEIFKQSLPSFYDLVKSYIFLGEDI